MIGFLLRFYGRVQRVGFRRHVLDLAQELALAGHVRNMPDGSVEAYVQGEESSVDEFLRRVRNPPFGMVKRVEERRVPFNPEVKEFRVVYGELAEELQEGFGAMQSIFLDYWSEFRDYRGEFRSFRDEFKDYRGEFGSFRDEFRDYREEFREFAIRTDENFRLISEKYGEISDKLTAILNTLIRESKETREMLNETMKTLKEALEKLGNGR